MEQDASSNDEGTDGSVDTIHLLQDLPAEGSGHNMNLRVQKMQKNSSCWSEQKQNIRRWKSTPLGLHCGVKDAKGSK